MATTDPVWLREKPGLIVGEQIDAVRFLIGRI